MFHYLHLTFYVTRKKEQTNENTFFQSREIIIILFPFLKVHVELKESKGLKLTLLLCQAIVNKLRDREKLNELNIMHYLLLKPKIKKLLPQKQEQKRGNIN